MTDDSWMKLAFRGGMRRRARGGAALVLNDAQMGLSRRAVGDICLSGERRVLLAAMEMGIGKTLGSLAALCVLRGAAQGKIRALFVVPKSTLHDAWLRQTRAFTRLRESDASFITYPQMQRAFISGWHREGGSSGGWVRGKGSAILEQAWDLLIFDESHTLRNPKRASVLGSAAAAAAKAAKRVICLSGTPIHNGPRDASGQLRAMMSGSGLEETNSFTSLSGLRVDAVERFSSRYVYSATLEDAGITLPPKRTVTHYVEHELRGEMAVAYNAALESCRGGREPGKREGSEHHMMTLRQLCTEAALYHKFGEDSFNETARQKAAANPGPKIREAMSLVRLLTLEGHEKVVIVSDFVSLLDTFKIAARKNLGEECLSFDGRLSAKKRCEVIDEFLHSDRRLLCLSMGAGACGLNLVPGPTAMIVLGVWFNPAVHRQVEARIHRIGQNKPVVIYNIVARGTIEEEILASHESKILCAEAILSGDVGLAGQQQPGTERLAKRCKRIIE